MTDMDPRLKDLIMDTTAEVLKDTGLDKKSFTDLTPEQVEMLCDRMGVEIKPRMIAFFDGLGTNSLKEHFDVIDEWLRMSQNSLNGRIKGNEKETRLVGIGSHFGCFHRHSTCWRVQGGQNLRW